jgi:hypothetical protein
LVTLCNYIYRGIDNLDATLSSTAQSGLVLDEHLVEPRNVVRPRLRVERQVGLLRASSLQRSALDAAVGHTPRQIVVAGLDSEVGQADLEWIPCRNRWAS